VHKQLKKYKYIHKSKKGIEKYGCIRQPIYPTIKIDHTIPDVLHLFLRVCDVLINLLITELRRLDGLDKIKGRKLDYAKVTHIAKYEKFLNQNCKVSFHFYIDRESKVLKW